MSRSTRYYWTGSHRAATLTEVAVIEGDGDWTTEVRRGSRAAPPEIRTHPTKAAALAELTRTLSWAMT